MNSISLATRAPATATTRLDQPARPADERALPQLGLAGIVAEELVSGVAHAPAGRDMGEFLGSHAGHVLLAGAWGWFAILVALAVFNTALGEELLFRGFLLPRMSGVFGRRDWVANGVLF